MWFLLLLFSFIVLGNDQAVEKYCAVTSTESELILRDLTPLLLPSEEITKQENCLILKLKAHRRSFIESYVVKKYPNTQVSFSSAEIKRETCFIRVEKMKRKNSNSLDLASTAGKSVSSNVSQLSETETINIQTINEFELSADQKQIKGNCRYITKNLYEIKISVHQNPKPITPQNLPQETILIINTPPPNQETSSLSTEIQLNRGQRIELGSFLKEINNKSKEISTKPNLQFDRSESLDEEQVFLSLE